MLPVHDINPLRGTPWVTYFLVAANVAVLLLTPASQTSMTGAASQAQLCSQQAFYDRYAAIPRELITGRQLALVATGQPGPSPDTCYVSRPAYRKEPALSVLYSMFLHAGWLHLLGNMLFLVVFGNNIEDRFRKIPYLLVYLFCGYVAAYGYASVYRTSVEPLIGASGAIAGVLGAYLVLYPAGEGLVAAAVLVLHPGAHSRVAGPRFVVRAAVGVLRGLRRVRRGLGGVSRAHLRLPGRPRHRPAGARRLPADQLPGAPPLPLTGAGLPGLATRPGPAGPPLPAAVLGLFSVRRLPVGEQLGQPGQRVLKVLRGHDVSHREPDGR